MASLLVLLTTDDGRMEIVPILYSTTVGELKMLAQNQFNIPANQAQLLFNGTPLAPDNVYVSQFGVQNNDPILVQMTNSQQFSSLVSPFMQIPMPEHDPMDPQLLLQRAKNEPNFLRLIERDAPELAEALKTGDIVKVRTAIMILMMDKQKAQWDRMVEIARLNANPFDPETQKKIEEEIKMQNIHDNMETAIEELPEAFAQVTMLYINCEANGIPLKAFVDSGAQSTIMTIRCAERCGLMRLCDRRFAGEARGVGRAKILGRVHMAQLKVGNYFFGCSFTIMEDNDVDFLFGLDMLRRHRCQIDLNHNVLRLEVGNSVYEEVPFLAESELPNKVLPNEAIKLQENSQQEEQKKDTDINSEQDEKIQRLIEIGFSREHALEALIVCDGDFEKAAQFLTDQDKR